MTDATKKPNQIPDTNALIVRGSSLRNASYGERNVGKEENLRGGSTGARIKGVNGYVSIGTCPRIAHLRVLGIEETIDTPTSLMFQGGHASEDALNEVLERGWKDIHPDNVFFPEGVVGVRWATATGRPVTGTPDGLYAVPNGPAVDLVRGVEAKCMSSGYTVIAHVLREKPKASYLLQAGHYSWQLGIPFDVVFVSRVNFHLGGFMFNLVKGLPDHPCYIYNDKGQHTGFRPTHAVYKVQWVDDKLVYHTPQDNRVATHVTTGDIRGFYEHVDISLMMKTVPDKGAGKDVLGNSTYSPCKYCVHKETCPTVPNGASEGAYADWVEDCKSNVATGDSEGETNE